MTSTAGGTTWDTAGTIGLGESSPSTPLSGLTPSDADGYYSAWWTFTATVDGYVQFDLYASTTAAGATYTDTTLTVYSGTNSARVQEAYDEGYVNTLPATHDVSAVVDLHVTAGVTYHVLANTFDSNGDGVAAYVLTATDTSDTDPHTAPGAAIRGQVLTTVSGSSTLNVNLPTCVAGDTLVMFTVSPTLVAGVTPGSAQTQWDEQSDQRYTGMFLKVYTRTATSGDPGSQVQISLSSGTGPVTVGIIATVGLRDYESFGVSANYESGEVRSAFTAGVDDLLCNFTYIKGAGHASVDLVDNIGSVVSGSDSADLWAGLLPDHQSLEQRIVIPSGASAVARVSLLMWTRKYGPWIQGDNYTRDASQTYALPAKYERSPTLTDTTSAASGTWADITTARVQQAIDELASDPGSVTAPLYVSTDKTTDGTTNTVSTFAQDAHQARGAKMTPAGMAAPAPTMPADAAGYDFENGSASAGATVVSVQAHLSYEEWNQDSVAATTATGSWATAFYPTTPTLDGSGNPADWNGQIAGALFYLHPAGPEQHTGVSISLDVTGLVTDTSTGQLFYGIHITAAGGSGRPQLQWSDPHAAGFINVGAKFSKDSAASSEYSYTIKPPRYRFYYRYEIPVTTVTIAPPLRQWPRSDALGASSARRASAPTIQTSLRRVGVQQ